MAIKATENLVSARVFLIGIIVALLAGVLTVFTATSVNPYILAILVLLGLIVGYFVAEKDVTTFLLASVSVVITAYAGLQGILINAAVGSGAGDIMKIISPILGSLLFLFVPSTIVVAIKTVFSLAKS